jgi:hypothetical protein
VRWPFVFYPATRTYFYADGIDIDLGFHRNGAGELGVTLSVQLALYELVRR